jgi:AraC family transcriptional activator of mtrCDE
MKAQPLSRISPPDLNNLMALLDVEVVALSECLVSAGLRLDQGGVAAPGIHYVLAGTGKVHFKGQAPIEVAPHTLIIVPPQSPFQLEADPDDGSVGATKVIEGRGVRDTRDDGVHRFSAGDDGPKTVMICGYFHAQYGASTGLFESLATPIVERFTAADRLDEKLKSAFEELLNEEIGAGAMSGALLKQVIVALLRRSLSSIDVWVERFAMLSDPQIARAFSSMVANPGASHTVESLAKSAFLSRSAFMARFAAVVGRSPMLVLRDLRMRQAAAQLSAGTYTIDQVVRNAGYASRSSFIRTFRKSYGTDPSGYRKDEHPAAA